jgi:hypothetical protein
MTCTVIELRSRINASIAPTRNSGLLVLSQAPAGNLARSSLLFLTRFRHASVEIPSVWT